MAARTGARSHGGSPATAMCTRCDRLAARRGLDARDAIFGVRDPLVVHPEEQLAERVLCPLDVAEREVALVKLSIRDALVDDAVDHPADRFRVLLRERTDGRLGAVGEHDDPGLFALRLRPGIPEGALVGRLTTLLRQLEEVLHHARAVVSRDH